MTPLRSLSKGEERYGFAPSWPGDSTIAGARGAMKTQGQGCLRRTLIHPQICPNIAEARNVMELQAGRS